MQATRSWYGADRSAIASGPIDDFEAYWRRIRGGRPMPRRGDFDPLQVRRILPFLVIGEFERDPFRVRYRLVGTEVVEHSQFDFTGLRVDEIAFHKEAIDFMELYRLIDRLGAPVYGVSRIPTIGTGLAGYAFGCFPFSETGKAVTQVMSIEDYRYVSDFDRGG